MATQSGGHWKNSPTPIMTPSNGNGSRGGNPYAMVGKGDNLHSTTRSSAQSSAGPHRGGHTTSSRTVLGGAVRPSSNINYHIPEQQPAKRQRISRPGTRLEHSKYFQNGQANGATSNDNPVLSDLRNRNSQGIGKGKGKERASLADAMSEVETMSSGGEDVGEPVHRERRRSSDSDDPLNILDQGSSPLRKIGRGAHAFDAPSKRGPQRGQHRLPDDGESTLRLQEQHKQRLGRHPEVIHVDSDDIESASGFDVEDVTENKARTPNGRTDIPLGAVKDKVSIYENKKAKVPVVPFRDLQKEAPVLKKSVVSSMKLKHQKPQSLSQFGSAPLGETLDPIATSPSGFSVRNSQLSTPAVLPLEAWSLGCELFENDEKNQGEPVSWISIQHNSKQRKHMLKILRKSTDKKGTCEFNLDRDFDAITYTDPSDRNDEWPSVVVVQLRTTRSIQLSHKYPHFEAGSNRAMGQVTFKFLTRHANWVNDSANTYKDFITVLKSQINAKPHVLRGVATKRCWEAVQIAAEHKNAEASRRSTRLNASTSSGQSSLSAGAANVDSTTVEVDASERKSVSAPPSRSTSNVERRVTRQSTRSTRTSPTPDLDELVLLYPPSGPGAVNITRGDLKRLDYGQYLNDTIIELGLKVWLDDLRKAQPELAEQVHVFNSFFYKKLASKKEVADTYATVRKWTSKVDIFKKKYIIVPINENFHWYLVIIEHPENMLHPPPPKPQAAPQTRKRKRESAAADAEKALETNLKRLSEHPPDSVPRVISVDAESEGEGQEVETMLRSCIITEPHEDHPAAERERSPDRENDVVAVDFTDAELHYPDSEEPMEVDLTAVADEQRPDRESSVMSADPISVDVKTGADCQTSAEPEVDEAAKEEKEDHSSLRDRDDDDAEPVMSAEELGQYPICYVYTFDSLGSRHPAASVRLAKYLQHEAVDKRNYRIEDTTVATQKRAKTPMQNNFCDCGLFVLAFVEAYMRDPVASSRSIQNNQVDWYPKAKEDLRERYRSRMVGMSEEWRKGRGTKEGEEPSGDKEKRPEGEGDIAKAKAPEPVVVDDDDDDEIVISEVVMPPPKSKAGNKGGKKEGAGKPTRLRG